MQTKRIPIHSILEDHEQVEEAAGLLRQGGVVAIPTETVYGLAANAYDGAAVAKIFAAKGRPMDNPLIVHISEFDMLPDLVEDIPEAAMELARRYWPGPLTIILKKSDRIPDEVSAGLPTVAVRMPSNTVARGKHLGSTLGFPTVNLQFPAGVLIPAHGVYACKVCFENGESHMAVTNVGTRPTVDDGDRVNVEGFILDFQGDLYGKNVRMEFYHRLRGEQKFPSLEALREEVMRNARETRAYFAARS